MIDTSKPLEFFSNVKQAWIPFRYLATASNGTIVGEHDGINGLVIGQYFADSTRLRNKPEPKRRELNEDEMRALVGTIVVRDKTRAVVSSYDDGLLFFGTMQYGYGAENVMNSAWRRLDGSGLWVEERT